MSTHVPPQLPRGGRAKIAFVGEFPSTLEVERGYPFAGPSGNILNAMLRTAGMDRYDYLITNVFNEKVPGNDIKHFCSPLKEAKDAGITDLPPLGAAGFLRAEYRWHLERLRDELERAQPNVIVPMGGTALWAFTGDTYIGGARGNLTPASFVVPGAKVLPTFHPLAVQVQWKFYPVVVGDLIKAQRESAFPEIRLPKRELLLEPTLQDIEEYLPRLLASDLLSTDIETGWGQMTCIGFAPDAEHAICIPFLDARKVNRSYWEDPADEVRALLAVKAVLEHPVPKLFQNGAYDLYWLIEKYGFAPRGCGEDTRLLHHNLYPELPKSLEFMAASYGTQGAWKTWGKKKKEKKDD